MIDFSKAPLVVQCFSAFDVVLIGLLIGYTARQMWHKYHHR